MFLQKKIFLGYFKKLTLIFVLVTAGLLMPQLAKASGPPPSVPATIYSIPAVSQTKLLQVNNVYYLAFASSTGSDYNLYITTSTNGTSGSWSTPVEVYSQMHINDEGGGVYRPIFDFAYSNFGGYFGVSVFSSSSPLNLLYTTSTNASAWSGPTTVYTSDNSRPEIPAISYSSSDNFTSIIYSSNFLYTVSGTSTWSMVGNYTTGSYLGGIVSGTEAAHTFYFFYSSSTVNGGEIYCATSSNGISWATTVIDNGLDYDTGPGGPMMLEQMTDINFDSNGNPIIAYSRLINLSMGAELGLTVEQRFAEFVGGLWVTSSIETVAASSSVMTSPGSSYAYKDSNRKVVGYTGSNMALNVAVNTGSGFTTSSITTVSYQDPGTRAGFSYSPTTGLLSTVYTSSTMMGLTINAIVAPDEVSTKMLKVGSVYYLAISSSTNAGLFDINISTSTSGADGSWGTPVLAYQNAKGENTDGAYIPSFDFVYNSYGGFFGLTTFSSSTSPNQIIYSTSTNAISWSGPVVATTGLIPGQKLKMYYSTTDNFVSVECNQYFATSTLGSSWNNSVPPLTGQWTFVDGLTSGNNVSHIFQFFYIDSTGNLIFASSSNGISFTSTTVDFGLTANGMAIGDHSAANLSANGDPILIYNRATTIAFDGQMAPIRVGADYRYAEPNGSGGWTTSSIASASFVVNDMNSWAAPTTFVYKDASNNKIVNYVGNNGYLYQGVNTSTSFVNSVVSGSAVDLYYTGSSAYDSSTGVLASYYSQGNSGHFSSSSVVTVEAPPEEPAYDGNLPIVPTDAKTKLLTVNGLYYLAFTSSTNSVYDVYLTTSTGGVLGTWSRPLKIFTGVKPSSGSGATASFFDFEYNNFGSYFGVTAFATSATEIWFASSTNGGSWSATTTVVGSLGTNSMQQRRIDLSFSTADEFALIGYGDSATYAFATSSNKGSSWSANNTVFAGGGAGSFIGSGISGSGGSRVLHYALLFASSTGDMIVDEHIIYVSSTDNGATWTSSTFAWFSGAIAAPWHSLAIDGNGSPMVAFGKIDEFSMGPATSSIYYYYKDNSVWITSTVATGVPFTINNAPDAITLSYFSTNKPIIFYPGTNLQPTYAVSTSTSPYSFSINSVSSTIQASVITELGMAYRTNIEVLGLSYLDSIGQLQFATSSLLSPPAEQSAWDGNLPSVPGDVSNTKLLRVNNLYDLFFTSTTVTSSFNLYLTTSTNGVAGTWSEPQIIFSEMPVVTLDQSVATFGAEYNSTAGYLAFSAISSSTGHIIIATSSNGVVWDQTDTGLVGSYGNIINGMSFASGTNFGIVAYDYISYLYSTDNWQTINTSTIPINYDDGGFIGGINAYYPGSGSVVVQAVYGTTTTTTDFIFVTTTDHVSFGSTTLVTGLDGGNWNNGFAVDSSGNAGFVYVTTTNSKFLYHNANGSWSTSNLGAGNTAGKFDLQFFNSAPFTVYTGASNLASFAYSTSSPYVFTETTNIGAGKTVGPNTKMSTVYDDTTNIAAAVFSSASNTLVFVTTSLDLAVSGGSAPTTPTGFATSTISTSSASMTWTDVADETGYIIQISTNGTAYVTAAIVAAGATSTTDSSVTPNTYFWFKIAAFNAYGTSSYSSAINFYTLPAIPSALTIATSTTSTIQLSLNANGNPASTTYAIYSPTVDQCVTTSTGGDVFGSCSNYLAKTITNWGTETITGLTPSTSYQVWAVAISATGNHENDANGPTSTFSTLAVSSSVPYAPTNFTISNITTSSVGASWTDNSSDELGFTVDFSIDGENWLFGTSEISANTSTAVFGDLDPNMHVWFRVAAYNSFGTSTYATSTGVYTNPVVPGIPTISNVSTSSVVAAWSGNGNAGNTLYYINYNGGFTTSTATTTSITGLTPSTSYQFAVRAQYLSSSTLYTAYSSSSTPPTTTLSVSSAPNTPSVFTVSNITATSMDVSWADNSNNEDGFTFEYSIDNGDTWHDAEFTTSSDVTSELVGGLTSNMLWLFRAAAYNAYGTSSYSNSDGGYTNPTPPGTPTISNVSTSSVTATWSDNSNASGTVYYINYNGGFATSTATTTSITGLTPSTSYQFAVRAQYLSNPTLYTAYSSSSTPSTTTLPVSSAPNAPTVLLVSNITTSTMEASWTDNSSNEDGFVLEYSLNGVSSWISGTTAEHTVVVDSLLLNTRYWFRVAAYNSFGTSTFVTSTGDYTNPTPPGTPTISNVSASSVAATWSDNGNASGTVYYINYIGGFTTSTATTTSITGLTPNTEYTFAVRAQYLSSSTLYTAYSSSSTPSTTTLANAPFAPTVTVSSTMALNLKVNVNSNPVTTTFSICKTTNGTSCAAGGYVQADGTLGASAVWQTYATWGGASGIDVTGLSVNTPYQFLVQAKNIGDITTDLSSANTAVYTLANPASAPTFGTPTTSTIPITINVNSNPTSTTYAIYNYTDSNYLTSAGVITATAAYYTTSTWNTGGGSAVGLTPNKSYQFKVIARNGGSVNAATSSVSAAVITDPVVPGTPMATANGQTSEIVAWEANSNSGSTVYELYNVTGTSTLVGTTTASSYIVTGLTAATSYQFKVRALYLSDGVTPTDYSSTSTAVSTASVGSSVTMTLGTGASSTFQLSGGVSHTVTVGALTSSAAELTLQSNTVHQSFPLGSTHVALNGTALDTTVTISSINTGAGTVTFSLANYTPPAQTSGGGGSIVGQIKPVLTSFVINNGAKTTTSRTVTLNFNASNVALVLFSNSDYFDSQSYLPYKSSWSWTLTPGNGLKTVYVRLRSIDGGEIVANQSITLNETTQTKTTTQTTDTPTQPKPKSQPSSQYQFTKDLKIGSSGEAVKQLQTRLKSLGYFTRSVTSYYGSVTAAAVKKLQTAKGLKATGTVDVKLRNILNGVKEVKKPASKPVSKTVSYTFSKLLTPGTKGLQIKYLQIRLQELGYLSQSIEPNGVFGPATKAAVIKLQKDYKLSPPVGNVGPATRKVLNGE